ncbi:SDR family oxidoreductase [Microbacterium sp. C5A9]|uniref:SDR family NAD(P)-dependent oxidoreductase n=1 Tax=Microbacterium sp. C5A9 TaxID=2736663 RepID=UPI001F528DE2|nr:SDR family oxidoreductase [Microbacterium sp. C5A9]MCI1020412.1 SDR family oxidoreductase [Microbacterium sp. C5A9]
MMGEPFGRLAVVTGGTGGIGTAIARKLAADGYKLVLHHVADVSRAMRVQRELGASVLDVVRSDLRSVEGVEAIIASVSTVLSEHRSVRLAGLVNNAAVMLGPGLREARPEDFDEYFAVNVRAPFFLSQRLSEKMGEGSSIVNVSSVAAHFSSPGDIVYAMSKTAIEAFARHAAPALAERGIRINTVVPGFTDNGHPAFQLAEVQQRLSSFSVLGGVAEPSTVADAVAFLLSETSARTTGTTLDVSGGGALGSRPAGGMSLRDLARRS